MKSIATLTMNPALDAAYDVDRVFHTHKVRSHGERYEPGGGGINVSRVINRLGGTARAYYLAGGATGEALDALLDYGRPAKVELCVLIDRKEHRQFPIQPDYSGMVVKTDRTDKVKLVPAEKGGEQVVLITQ